MSARINYAGRSRERAAVNGCPCGSDENSAASSGCPCANGNGSCPCTRSVNFCETLTLHESFDASSVCSSSAKIAYDTSFLGYTVDEMTMDAELPCGGTCPVEVYRISLTGAIPYIINVGTVSSGCGANVCLSVEGSTMVDEVVGYACGGSEPDLTELACSNVTPSITVVTEQCGCSEKTNVTVCGTFTFSNLPSLM